MIQITNHENYTSLMSQGKIALIEFSAQWCGPCKVQKGILLDIENTTKIPIGIVDIEENHQLADSFNIKSVPTILVFKDGEIKAKLNGVQQKDKINKIIESV